MKLNLVKDNTTKDIPTCPTITYSIVADLDKSGTKTVFECGVLEECYKVLNQLKTGEITDIPNQVIGITKEELEAVTGFSILIQLSAEYLNITDYGCEMIAEAELQAYKVEKDK